MSETVEIQPALEHRREFARWCVSQNPRIETASMNSSNVPVELFTSIPEALLVGAKIDGTPYRHVIENKAPEGDGYKDAEEEVIVPAPRRSRRGSK